MQVVSCGSSPRGRTCIPPSPHAGARLGRLALPGDGRACIGQANDVTSTWSSCRGDSGWPIASIPLNGAVATDGGGCWGAVRRTGFADKSAVVVRSLIPAVAKRRPPGVWSQRGVPALAKIGYWTGDTPPDHQAGVHAPGCSKKFAKPFGGSCSEPGAPLKAAQQLAGQALYWNVRWWGAARQLVPRRGTQESCRRRTRRLPAQ